MPSTPEERLAENKRLLQEMLKNPKYQRAELVEALKAVNEEQALGVDAVRNAIAMRNAKGQEILYMLLKKNRVLTLFHKIKKWVFELVYNMPIKSK